MGSLRLLHLGYPVQGLALAKSRLNGPPPSSVPSEVYLLGGLLTVSVGSGRPLFRVRLITGIAAGRAARGSTHDGPYVSTRARRRRSIARVLGITGVIVGIAPLGLRFHGGIHDFVRSLLTILRVVVRRVGTAAGSRPGFVEFCPTVDIVPVSALTLSSCVELVPDDRPRSGRRTIRTSDVRTFLEDFVQTVGIRV